MVREYIAGNAAALWRPGVHAPAPTIGWAGRTLAHSQRLTVALLPQRLREILARAGISLDAVLPGWQESAAIVRTGEGRGAWTPNVRLDRARPRMYVFSPGVMDLSPAPGDEHSQLDTDVADGDQP